MKARKGGDEKNKALRAPVFEIFSSWQGEGLFAGRKQVFVRFSGCNLSCSYCDEKASSLPAGRMIRTPKRLPKTGIKSLPPGAGRSGVWMTPEEAAKRVKKLAKDSASRFVSFTGGEPLLYAGFIKVLIKLLGRRDFRFFLETNGTLPEELSKIAGLVDIISMDLKMPSSCGKRTWEAHKKFLELAGGKAYVKVVVSPSTPPREFRKGVEIVAAAGPNIPFYIQPESSWFSGPRRGKNVFVVCEKFYRIASARLGDVSVLPQLHRLWGVK